MALMALAVACGGGTGPPPPPPVQNGQVNVGGLARPYRVFVPPTLDRSRPAPVLMVLHGGNMAVDDMVRATLFDQEASSAGYIAVYPEATMRAWNAGTCCGSAPRRNPDDVGFLIAVLDQVGRDHRVDPERVFVAGVSNGAMMAYRFACERAERVTAVASVAGAVVIDPCRPSRPVSVIEIHGTEDPLVPYEGGDPSVPEAGLNAPYTSTPEMVGRWAELAGCGPAGPAEAAGPVTTQTWAGCQGGAAVRLVTVEGGGHIWFTPGLGPANGALDATVTIGRFLDGLPAR